MNWCWTTNGLAKAASVARQTVLNAITNKELTPLDKKVGLGPKAANLIDWDDGISWLELRNRQGWKYHVNCTKMLMELSESGCVDCEKKLRELGVVRTSYEDEAVRPN